MGIAFVVVALGLSTTGCVIYFLKRDRHAKWENRIKSSVGGSDAGSGATATVEMGALRQETPMVAVTTSATAMKQATVATMETAVAIPAESYVSPKKEDAV